MSIRNALLELRLRYGSMEAVAKARGVNRDYLYRLYTGERKNPSQALIKKLGLRAEVHYTIDPKEHQ